MTLPGRPVTLRAPRLRVTGPKLPAPTAAGLLADLETAPDAATADALAAEARAAGASLRQIRNAWNTRRCTGMYRAR